MKSVWTVLVAGASAVLALGFNAASAKYRPDPCSVDHDHRSHHADYYDYYAADKYYRAGPYRKGGLSFSIRLGDNGYVDFHDGYARYDRYDRGRRHGYRGRRGRVLNREVYDTRYRARIVLTEEVVRTRRGPRLVCTVAARGPEADYVSKRRLKRIARRDCSHRARVRIYA